MEISLTKAEMKVMVSAHPVFRTPFPKLSCIDVKELPAHPFVLGHRSVDCPVWCNSAQAELNRLRGMVSVLTRLYLSPKPRGI